MTTTRLRLGDNHRLSPRRRYRETPDVAKGVGRIVLAVGKRVATEDPADLRYLALLEQRLNQAWDIAIDGLRTTGYTDGEIGSVLGITKQAVQKRWPRPF